jgi:hypothetical protein
MTLTQNRLARTPEKMRPPEDRISGRLALEITPLTNGTLLYTRRKQPSAVIVQVSLEGKSMKNVRLWPYERPLSSK